MDTIVQNINLTLDNLTDFCVCKFADINHKNECKKHFYINIPLINNSYLLFCMVTSKREEKKRYYSKNPKALKALVEVTKSDINCLPYENHIISIINCNEPSFFTSREIFLNEIDKYNTKPFEIPQSIINTELQCKIIDAIMISPLVKPNIKKLINAIN